MIEAHPPANKRVTHFPFFLAANVNKITSKQDFDVKQQGSELSLFITVVLLLYSHLFPQF